jgi:NAD-dependent DNA ligase
VLSEKLDGLSALWTPENGALYLRGDGETGQNISPLAKHICGLVKTPSVVRGELILPRTAAAAGARAIVNGLLHQKKPDPEKLKQVRFIAYEVISPAGLTRQDQFAWLSKNGFETPWWSAVLGLTEEACAKAFDERRTKSAYETDGIVVGINQMPEGPRTTKPPKDCVAFKMVVADQAAVTTVRAVLWAASAQGYLIPRIQFDPVKINGANIEFCTGHNARTIVDQRIGPGAVIRVRRSGDVIPTLDSVVLPAKASLPEDVTTWVWTEGENPTHICTKEKTSEQVVSQLQHFAKTHDIPGLGPANCRALVEGKVNSPATLWKAPEATLCDLLGPKSGKTLHENLRKILVPPALTEMKLMLSSSQLPRGMGEAKLKTLFEVSADPRRWFAVAAPPPGWTEATLGEFQQAFPEYEKWRQEEVFWIPYPILGTTQAVPATPQKQICFTGFRDKALEQKAAAKGFEVIPNMTSKVSILIVADGQSNSTSEKIKKARNANIPIMECSEFTSKYIS